MAGGYRIAWNAQDTNLTPTMRAPMGLLPELFVALVVVLAVEITPAGYWSSGVD